MNRRNPLDAGHAGDDETAADAPGRRAVALQPRVLWLTGLSGAGKSTLAHGLKRRLDALKVQSVVLDGDVLRKGLNSDLGFSAADRTENVRRTAEVAALFQRAGFVVICALISPLVEHRQMARRIVGAPFSEVFVDAPLDVCEQRDPKGLYRQARRGALQQFTGIDAPYEVPTEPDLIVQTRTLDVEQSIELLRRCLMRPLTSSSSTVA